MLATTFTGDDVFLLNDEPDWRERISLRALIPSTLRRGLTGREGRRPIADVLRASLSWSALLDRAQANALRDALQALGNEPVLCPAWPFAVTGAQWAAANMSGGLMIGWLADWSDFEIGAPVSDPASWDYIAPLLYGRLEDTPAPEAAGLQHLAADFEFTEDGPAGYALDPDAVTWANGPALADATVPKIFPFVADWNRAPKSGAAEVEIERVTLARARQTADVYYPQSAERPIEASLLLTSGSEIATLLRWFQDRHGSAEAHYAIEAVAIADLAANASAGTNTLTLVDASALGINRFLELSRGDTREIVRIGTIVGNVCTLGGGATLAHTWLADGYTLLRAAMLARHARDELRLDFSTPEIATARIAWRELPAEYTVASGETRGTTLGKLPTEAELFEVTLDWVGATEVHRFTSFERTLTASAQTWTSRPAERSEIRQNVEMDRDEVTLTVRWWEDCPFRVFLPNALDCKVTLKIYRCTVSGATGSGVTQIFGGEITGQPGGDGPMLKLTAAGNNALFDRSFPRFNLGKTCGNSVYDAGCTLALATWTFAGVVYSYSNKTLVVDFTAIIGGVPGGFGFNHYFALGYVERTIGSEKRRHLIYDSAAISSNRISLTLGAAPTEAPAVNDDVSVVVWCDNRPETCKAWHTTNNPTGKFNNFANFGGNPFSPDKDPAFQPLKKSDSATGKK